MSFKVGDWVVCVEIKNLNHEKPAIWLPVINGIYEIVGLHILGGSGELYLEFPQNEEDGYNAKYFRKLDYDFVEEVIEKIKEQPVEA